MLRLADLYVYPLKSARGIRLDQVELDAFGIRYDRRWMFVDSGGALISQRTDPRLALVRTAFAGPELRLTAPSLPPLQLPLAGWPGPQCEVRVWEDYIEAVDQGDEPAAWATAHLGRPARLVHMPDHSFRPLRPNPGGVHGRASFADAFPLLLIGQTSLDALNARLPQPVSMNRFRPNMVVAGAAPHAEDEWRRFSCGGITFTVAKPCARCVLTTVDQETGVKGTEPLRTLATYRTRGQQVLFGQNVAHAGPGRLAVGDGIELLEAAEVA
jgi:hypothetical protein